MKRFALGFILCAVLVVGLAATTTYKGLTILDPDPTGEGGLLIQNDFKYVADKLRINPVIVVAGANTSSDIQARADYVCDGTADEVEINQAIAALPDAAGPYIYETSSGAQSAQNEGGTVVLVGTFQIADPIDLSGVHGICLRGEGASTVVYNTQTDGGHAIYCVNSSRTYGSWHVQIRDLRVTGVSGSGDGVHVVDCPHFSAINVIAASNGGNGFYRTCTTEAKGADNGLFLGCRATLNGGHGLYTATVHETIISACHFEENGGTTSGNAGIRAAGVYDLMITGCNIEDHATASGVYGIYATSCGAMEIGTCIIEDACAINLTSTNEFFASNVDFINAVTFTGSSAVARFTGCYLYQLSYTCNKLYLANSRVNLTSGSSANCFVVAGGFLYLPSGASYTTNTYLSILGPQVQMAGTATFLAGADNCEIAIGNIIVDTTDDLTIDGNGKSTVRCTLSGSTMRYAQLCFEDLAYLNVSGNTLIGSGILTFTNCDTLVGVTGNVLSGACSVSIDATCAANCNFQVNTVSGCTLTNNGSGTITNANNALTGTCTGWGT